MKRGAKMIPLRGAFKKFVTKLIFLMLGKSQWDTNNLFIINNSKGTFFKVVAIQIDALVIAIQ